MMSHPTMGAWIEIISIEMCDTVKNGRTPRWVRGLKSKGRVASGL